MKNKDIKIHLKAKHEEFINTLYNSETKDLIKSKTYFAGGAVRDLVRGEEPKDYDLFFIDQDSLDQFKILVKKEYSLKKTKILNFNCITTQTQVITLVSGSPDDVVDTFDFTINQGYYLPQMDSLVLGEINNSLIVCSDVLSPLQALLRVEKFRKKGYDCPMQVLVDLGVAISKLDPLNTEDKVKKALMGMSFSEVLEDVPQVSKKKSMKTVKNYNVKSVV